MKHLKFFFVFLILFFSICQISYGASFSPIQNITYKGYLTGTTEINITGELENCDLVSINGKQIKYKKEKKQISFYFKDINSYKGIIKVNCNGKIYQKDFFFPHLTKYNISLNKDFENIIEVYGENFNDKSSIYLGTTRLPSIQKTDRYIISFLRSLNGDLYVKQGSISSNLLKINIAPPEIKYIKSDNGFRIGTNLNIYVNNFDYSPENFLLVNNDKYQLTPDNYKEGYINFKLPEKYVGENTISIVKNKIKSNIIKIKIYPNIPIINQITAGLDKNGIKILKIKGENFIANEKLKVKLMNFGDLPIRSINKKEIIVEQGRNIKKGNNYIYIQIEGLYSNVYNYFIPGEKEPIIGSITPEKLTPDNKYRVFRLTTNYFNKKTDELLVNERGIKFGAYRNLIKANIPRNITEGYFHFKRDGKDLNYIRTFDFRYNYSPIINYISIKGEPKYGTKIEIVGKNFSFAKITENNLLGKKEDKTLDITITNSKIIGYLPKNFNPDRNSNITIENNGITTKLSFNLGKIKKSKINGPFILNKITNESDSFIIKQGDTINVFGSYFHNNDKIYLNDKKISFKYINPEQIKIKLPEDIKPGIYTLKIKNDIGIESKIRSFYVFNKHLNPKIKIYQEKNSENKIIVNPINQEHNKSEILKYSVQNYINDFQVNKVIFKVENYDKNLLLGEFELKFNNRNISKAVIDDKGYITFSIPFFIDRDFVENKELILKKEAPYVKPGKFKIKLEKIEGVFIKNGEELEGNNIEINNIDTEIKIEFIQKNINNCIDKESKLYNCNTITQNNNSNNLNSQNNNSNNLENNAGNNTNSYVKLLINSRHKLERSELGEKYMIKIDSIIKKINSKKTLAKLKIKTKKTIEKLKNTQNKKYNFYKSVLEYFYAKLSLKIESL